MKKIIFFLIVIMVLAAVFLYQETLLGKNLEPKLEAKLEELFGMPVFIEDLRANAVTGYVTASYLEFSNQDGFSEDAHLKMRGIRFYFDVLALRDKRIVIRDLHLYEPYYLIERKDGLKNRATNLLTWLVHMRSRPKTQKPQVDPDSLKEKFRRWFFRSDAPWTLHIDAIHLHDGTFKYLDQSETEPRLFRVSKINGPLRNFEWPSEANRMPQTFKVSGDYGTQYPVAFTAEGKANFSTKIVSFDFEGTVKDGDVREFAGRLKDMPFKIASGTFDLETQFTCLLGKVKSRNALVLKELDIKTREKVVNKIWGAPVIATISFIEDQKKIELAIPVQGNLKDPQFDVRKAFQKAFANSMEKSVREGVKSIQDRTKAFVESANQLVRQVPAAIAQKGADVMKGAKKERSLQEEVAADVMAEVEDEKLSKKEKKKALEEKVDQDLEYLMNELA